jgi:hypothetical protein
MKLVHVYRLYILEHTNLYREISLVLAHLFWAARNSYISEIIHVLKTDFLRHDISLYIFLLR